MSIFSVMKASSEKILQESCKLGIMLAMESQKNGIYDLVITPMFTTV